MKAEIKYRIKDANGLSEILMITEINNPIDIKEAINLIKCHYKEQYEKGIVKINEAVDSFEKTNNSKFSDSERTELIDEYYFYDENSIGILSINDLSIDELEKPKRELEEKEANLLRDKLIVKIERLAKKETEVINIRWDIIDSLFEKFNQLDCNSQQEFLNKIKRA